MAQQQASVTITGTPENPVFNFVLPEGAKGEPGGWNVGTNLGTSDLDTITTPGLYYQSSTGSALALDNHYPPMKDMAGSVRGVMEVISWSGGNAVIQRFTRIGSGGSTTNVVQRPRVVYERYREGAWSEWSVVTPSQLVTDSLGFRTIQVWDEQSNAWLSTTGPNGLMGQSLNTVSLNELFTPGTYHQWSSTYATLERGYPKAGIAGIVQVTPWTSSAGSVMQEFTVLGSGGATNSPQRPRLVYQRYFATQWSEWSVMVPQRVDNTAGKAIYTWDDTANKEQLIYGDTGWRNISSLIPTWTKGLILYRRTLNNAEFVFEAAEFSDPINTPITMNVPNSNSILTGTTKVPSAATGLDDHRFEWNWDGNHRVVKTTATGLRGYVSFPCRASWPTTLPGVAFG